MKFTDPDGRDNEYSNYLFGFMSRSSNPVDQLVSLFPFASNGDEQAQQQLSALGYQIHEAGRDQLKQISDATATGTLLFLCVGQPEVSGVLGGVSLVADGILLLDSLATGDYESAGKDATFMVASWFAGKGVSKGVNSKGINI